MALHYSKLLIYFLLYPTFEKANLKSSIILLILIFITVLLIAFLEYKKKHISLIKRPYL